VETAWKMSLITLWAVTAANLLLTLRVVRWLRAMEDARKRSEQSQHAGSLLLPGTPAPNFRAKTLSGEPVRLADYVGRKVAFVFVSPHCGGCRQELPMLNRLGRLAAQRAGVELTLVSDVGAAETRRWLQSVRDDDGVEVDLPVLIAPYSSSNLLVTYNPSGLLPSYCFVDEEGIVQAAEPLGKGEWPRLQREWTAPPTLGSRRWNASQAPQPR
jgi:thiol-disulfide isomerase/thioredoxin